MHLTTPFENGSLSNLNSWLTLTGHHFETSGRVARYFSAMMTFTLYQTMGFIIFINFKITPSNPYFQMGFTCFHTQKTTFHIQKELFQLQYYCLQYFDILTTVCLNFSPTPCSLQEGRKHFILCSFYINLNRN